MTAPAQAPAVGSAYPILGSSLKIGPRLARNRIWMTAHATLLVKDHLFTDAHIAYYEARAEGGAAVITMEAMAAHPTTQPYKGKAFAFDPRMVPEYRKLAAAVHRHDTLLLAQPWHRGRQTNSVTNGLPVWAPSALPCAVYREMPHVMTTSEISELVQGYRLAARYAREGGLDGVEVHGASHGYMLNQFLSPATNHRSDSYGGSIENRMRIVMEILEATREETGDDMIVGMRINSDDGHPGGLGPSDWADLAQRFVATGMVDYISCSHGTYINRMLIYPTSPENHGFQLEATAQVKAAIDVPVIGAGRIVDPDEAEAALAEDKCDMIGMARGLISDPRWGEKALGGEAKRIRPCVGANWCMTTIFAQAPIGCIHNPAAGQERELDEDTLDSTKSPKRIAVVGGGPGGLRTAWTLARRGHSVTLYEAREVLGGQVRFWSRAPSRRELLGIVDWLADRVKEEGVEIRLGISVSAADLTEFDSVVVATGSEGQHHGWTPARPAEWAGPPIPGADLPHVLSYTGYLGAEPLPSATRAVLFDSLGGRQGAVAAEVLATNGAEVHFVTQLGQGSPDLAASRDWGKVHGMLRRAGVRFHPDSELTEITEDAVALRDVYTGATETIDGVDRVVMVVGSTPRDGLLHELQAAGTESHAVGDAVAPRRVNDAIREGELLARRL